MSEAGSGDVAEGEDGSEAAGEGIVRLSLAVTWIFVVMALAAAVAPDTLGVAAAVLDGALFIAGCVLFLWAFAVAVARSRTEEVSVVGVYFLSGTAPAAVRRRLLGAFAVQVTVAVVTASVRLYTPVAFGILVPVLGLGVAGLWGARHGTFPPRSPGGRDRGDEA